MYHIFQNMTRQRDKLYLLLKFNPFIDYIGVKNVEKSFCFIPLFANSFNDC